MRDKICYIVGAGDFTGSGIEPQTDDFIIAADGGYAYLKNAGIRTDLIIGDFDSLPEVGIPRDSDVIRLKKEKDDTDMLAALREGLSRGYKCFHIYGGTGGGRFDHTLANIQCLAYLSQKGARGYLFGRGFAVTAITDSNIIFGKERKGYISVFSHSEISKGVNLTGLKYPLVNAVLTNTFPLGVSNEFTGVESQVSVADGTLVITYCL